MIRNPEKTIGTIIDKCSIAQLCYVDKDGFPVTRAMLKPRERNGLREFQYYSKGVTDPDYCVIKITVQKVRYYSNFKSTDFNV